MTVPATGVSLVLEPAEQKMAPRTEYEAKFSLQYSAASMIVRGHGRRGDYREPAIADPSVLELAARCGTRSGTSRRTRRRFPARVRIRTRDGAIREADSPTSEAARRTRGRPATCARSSAGNAALALSEPDAAAFEQAILELEERDDLRAALAPLAGTARVPA